MLQRLLALPVLLPALLLGGCSWTGGLFKSDKTEYKSENKAAKTDVPTLEGPPDLTRQGPPPNEARRGVSQSELDKAAAAPAPVSTRVLPPVSGAHIERAGTDRWLVLTGRPNQYWDAIREFWQESGFVMSEDKPESGVMETDWNESKPRVSQGVVRQVVGNVVDMQSSTPVRDKFRTRLETNSRGQTEIYISHRGLTQVFKNDRHDQFAWEPRPPEPDLEVEYLRRLMLRLGSDEAKAAAQTAAAGGNGAPKRSKIVRQGNASAVELDDTFDRAWRRVSVALDRVGFTVEDRDRTKGLFYVRYADPDAVKSKKSEGMFGSIVKFFDQDKSVPAEQYQIQVTTGSPATRVVVLSKAGVAENTQTTQRILSLLNEQLE